MSWIPGIIQAQNSSSEDPVLYLTLQEAIDRAEVQNVQVEIAERDIDIARGAYRQTHATFLPQLSIEETGVATNDPLHVFGYRLKQESVTPTDFDPGRLNDPGRFDNFSTRVELRQPLLNADRFFERRSVSQNVKASREALRGTKAHIRYQVKDVYYRLQLLSQQRSVLEQTLQTARENDRQATDLHDQEMINRADMLAARVRVLELESHLSGIQNQIQDIQGELRYLMDVEDNVEIVAIDSLQKVPARSELSIESVSLQNGTLRAMEHSISAAKESLKASQWSALPSINLFGSYEFNDEIPFGTRGDG
ncbi:MAG: TolC family protein, partial [Bacteroidota bacterium]